MASSTWRESSPSISRTWSVDARRLGERVEEARGEVAAEPAGARLGQIDVAGDERPLRDLERDLRERLLGGHERRAVAAARPRREAGRRTPRRAPGRRPRPRPRARPAAARERARSRRCARAASSRWSRTGMPVATFELHATERDPGAHGSETSRIGGFQFRARIAHHQSGFALNPPVQGELDAACQPMRLRRAGEPSCSRARPWAHATASASAAWPSGTRRRLATTSEQALAAALERHPARVVRRIPRAARRRAATGRRASSASRSRSRASPGSSRVERTTPRGARAAEPALVAASPAAALPVAVRRDARGPRSGSRRPARPPGSRSP